LLLDLVCVDLNRYHTRWLALLITLKLDSKFTVLVLAEGIEGALETGHQGVEAAAADRADFYVVQVFDEVRAEVVRVETVAKSTIASITPRVQLVVL